MPVVLYKTQRKSFDLLKLQKFMYFQQISTKKFHELQNQKNVVFYVDLFYNTCMNIQRG